MTVFVQPQIIRSRYQMQESVIRTRLLELNRELSDLVESTGDLAPAATARMVDRLLDQGRRCEKRLRDDLLRMAVVGTIKSGKSTFINAFFSGDYLKRGAGVITSIVTKVQAADNLRARLFFKSWDEINREIEQALRIFLSSGLRKESKPFDIRDEKDRAWLSNALAGLESKYLLTRDTRNIDHVLLGAYLKSYDRASRIIGEEGRELRFEGDDFPLHRDFAGSEDLSVLLRDIRLEIDTAAIEKNIEIADCQGSDSPNPLHLAMIQDYLRSADVVAYVVSSRTGIRQADIRFLTMIRNMCGMEHVLFTVNADFSEHESIGDLNRVAEKVKEDLRLITPEPRLYVFSSLHSLFSGARDQLGEKDLLRLEQWETDEKMVLHSQSEERRFRSDLEGIVTGQRVSIVLKNQAHCLDSMIADLERWLRKARSVVGAEDPGAAGLLDKTGKQGREIDRVRSMIKTTMDGAVFQLKKEIRSDVDRFFDFRRGELAPGVVEFVQGYAITNEELRRLLENADFFEALAAVFQAFKQDLDRYMAETVNPLLLGFIRKKELEIGRYFESMAGPYQKMVSDARAAATSGPGAGPESGQGPLVDLEAVKEARGLDVPSAAATLDYSGSLKTEAFMKLGFYRLSGALKKLFTRGESRSGQDVPALRAGVARMKKETEASLSFYFKNYRENIKYQYFFKLIESVSEELFLQLSSRFEPSGDDFSELQRMSAGAETEPEPETNVLDRIEAIHERLMKIKEEIASVKTDLEGTGGPVAR